MVACHLAHARVMAALHADAFEEPWPESAFAELTVQHSVSGWIAQTTDPMGFILIRRASDEMEILTLAVARQNRRLGVAAALVNHALALANTDGARTCYLEVAVDNEAACALYKSCGFAQTGERPKYYRRGASKIDALIMSRALP